MFDGNVSAWARAADDMSTSTLNGVISKGRADPDTLARIARGAKRDPAEAFRVAGWLDPELQDLEPEATTAARVIQDLKDPLMRRAALLAVLGIAQAAESPEYRQRTEPYLRIADRPADQE